MRQVKLVACALALQLMSGCAGATAFGWFGDEDLSAEQQQLQVVAGLSSTYAGTMRTLASLANQGRLDADSALLIDQLRRQVRPQIDGARCAFIAGRRARGAASAAVEWQWCEGNGLGHLHGLDADFYIAQAQATLASLEAILIQRSAQ